MEQYLNLKKNLGKNRLSIRKFYKVLEGERAYNEAITSNRKYRGF